MVPNRVRDGYRLPQPSTCPDECFELISSMWDKDPEARPTFSEIRARLEAIEAKVRPCAFRPAACPLRAEPLVPIGPLTCIVFSPIPVERAWQWQAPAARHWRAAQQRPF